MEDFSKMIEVYRWRAEESHTEKQHHDSCASPCASPAQAIPCNVEEEEAGATTVRCSFKKDDEGHFTSPRTSSFFINRSHMEPQSVGRDVGIQNDHSAFKSFVSDDDGDVSSQNIPDKALSYSPGSYKPGQKGHLKKKPRASSRSSSSRQLVFGVKGRVNSKVKLKKERKKSRQTQTKQNDVKLSSKKSTKEDYMPAFYDDSTCEDGPIDFYDDSTCDDGPLEFCSPDVPHSPGVASQPCDRVASNALASNKKKRRSTTLTKGMAPHAPMNGKSPFFAHAGPIPNPNNAKKRKKSLWSTPSENKSADIKVYTRRRKKASPILSREGNTIDSEEGKESSALLVESSDRNDGNAVSFEGAVFPIKATSKAKTSAYFTAVQKALGQRDIANKTWVPPISVYTLIQEELYRDPWKVLVACMLLNKTCGTQMRKIIWDLFALCPTPKAAIAVKTEKIEEVIRPLGLQNKRARMIQKFSKDYLGKEWVNVGELHGIGKYATDAYAIFCEGRWREVKPEDHKLVDYWRYLCATDGLGYAFKDDREKGCEVVCTGSQAEI